MAYAMAKFGSSWMERSNSGIGGGVVGFDGQVPAPQAVSLKGLKRRRRCLLDRRIEFLNRL